MQRAPSADVAPLPPAFPHADRLSAERAPIIASVVHLRIDTVAPSFQLGEIGPSAIDGMPRTPAGVTRYGMGCAPSEVGQEWVMFGPPLGVRGRAPGGPRSGHECRTQ